MQNRKLWLARPGSQLIAALGFAQAELQKTAAAQGASKPQAPIFEVDPLWPKPLPNHWLLGSTIGVWADDQDHIWIIHRSSATLDDNERGAELKPPTYECCVGAPPVLEFDQEGNLVHHWGGPGQGYEWPDSNHGIFVDHGGNVWIAGNGGPDGHILKFTKDGKFLAQFGKKGARPGPPADRRTGRRYVASRQQRPRQLRPAGEDLHRPQDQRSLYCGRLPQSPCRGSRRTDGQDEALLGRVRQQAGRQRSRPL